MDKVLFKEKKRFVQDDKKDNDNPFSYIVSAVLIVISGFLLFNSFRSFQIMQEKISILQRANSEVSDLRLRNISLILEKEKIETDDYTETDIRNRLNYSKKNEIIFVIPQEVLDLSKMEVERILAEKGVEVVEKSNFEIWKELFLYGI